MFGKNGKNGKFKEACFTNISEKNLKYFQFQTKFNF